MLEQHSTGNIFKKLMQKPWSTLDLFSAGGRALPQDWDEAG